MTNFYRHVVDIFNVISMCLDSMCCCSLENRNVEIGIVHSVDEKQLSKRLLYTLVVGLLLKHLQHSSNVETKQVFEESDQL